jgi:crotonobetainyl-CoA:carnitine CoA-transferase CaiB-like acyl-CoA transferase
MEDFRDFFETFARERDRSDLYLSGQASGVLVSPINSIADLLVDRQLLFERWFTLVELPEYGPTLTPGPPFRISGAGVGPLQSLKESIGGWDGLDKPAEATDR